MSPSLAERAWTLLLILLLAALCLTLAPRLARSQAACTHYASPQGQGSSCARDAPCAPQTFLDTMATQPGRVLCMHDGVYGNLSVPATFAGTADKPIWIRAEHEGKVRIGSGAGARPMHLQGSHGVLWGVNLRGGDNATLRFYTNSVSWKVQRVVIHSLGSVNAAIDMQGKGNLVEDFVVFGQARYVVSVTTSGANNTVRRGGIQWADNQQMESSSPTAGAILGYGQDTVRFENLLINWNTRGRVTDPGGIGVLWSTHNSQWLGSILYVRPTDTFSAPEGFGGTTDAGSHAQEGNFHPTTNLLWKHNVVYLAPENPSAAGKPAIRFTECTDAGCGPGSGNLIQDSVGVGAVPSSISSSFTASGIQDGATLAEAIGAGKSVWTDSNAAPGICRRYKDGVVTNEPLWPFPMNQRLIDYMTAEGLTPVDVTATMEGLLGRIPPACRTDGGPPVPDTEPPRITMTAPASGTLVSGSIAVAAEAADNVGVVAVQFFVGGVARGMPQCCEHVSGHVDSTVHANGFYTLTAEARDAAGNRALSAPVQVLLANGLTRPPLPPAGGTLACTGTVAAVPGGVTLECGTSPGR
jgi:hypothetical protein